MLRPLLLAVLLAPAPAAAEAVLHLFGSDDCPPCLAFRRDHLDAVRALGRDAGFEVETHVIGTLRDMDVPGMFGAADPLLRAATRRGAPLYPPVFVVSEDGRVLSAHGGDWGAAVLSARDAGG
jgi:hypothetical protein